jgi:hypothetical protein
VHVDGTARAVHLVGDRRDDEWADRDRRNEMAVHHVDVNQASAGGHHLGDLLAQAREVR